MAGFSETLGFMIFDIMHFVHWAISWLGAVWWIAAVGLFLFTCLGALIQPWLQRARATNKAQPPVSAILPIKRDNPGFKEAEDSIFRQTYPQIEVIFAATEADPGVLAEAKKLAEAHPEVLSRFMESSCGLAVSPKLNNLATPLAEAAHDFVMTKDSNILFEPETLSAFMQNFAPGVGLVVGVPVAERPEGLAGHIEAFLLNGHARLLLTASALGGGFGVGKTMLFKRSDFARAGGLESVAYTIAEDTAICRAMTSLGLKTVFAHRTLRQIIGRRNLREIYNRQLRWGVIRRTHEPLTFPLEPISSPLPAAIAAAFAAPLIGLSAIAGFGLTLVSWFAIEVLIALAKGWEISPMSPAAFIGREILALASWLHAWTTNDVVWAEGRFDVLNGAHDAALSLEGQSPRGEKG